MANLIRVRTTWNGQAVTGEGVTTFYFDEAHTGFLADIHTFWGALGGRIAAGVVLRTENSGDLIDVATGELSGTWTDGAGSTITTSSAGAFAAGVGARLAWATSGIRSGRRVRGTMFVCPLTIDSYQVDGSIVDARVTELTGVMTTFLTAAAGAMRIYSRPKPGLNGQANTVIGGSCPDKVSWLRSRRT